MNSDLLRQRRNLIGISVALLLFKFSDTPVDRLTILGTELHVTNVYGLGIFAWMLLAYFLIRYYQYLKSEPDLGIKSHVDSVFRHKTSQFYFRKTGRQQIYGEIRVARTGLKWRFSVWEHHTEGDSSLIETETGELPFFRSWWWRLQTYFDLTMHTPKITDYALPYLLAAAATIQLIVGLVH